MARSTHLQMQERYDAILRFASEQKPGTVRGIYYHLCVLGLIPKTDAGYQKVAADCKKLRLSGEMPFEWVADNTRQARVYQSFTGVADCLDQTVQYYRRDLMHAEDLQIEIWLEKDALAGVFLPVTAKYDVPLMVSRGFASLSFLHESAKALNDGAIIYIFTDHDAAGAGIDRNIEKGLREFSDKQITVKRAMLSREQVDTWGLSTREPKAADKKDGYEFCCELDAVTPVRLREEVEKCINEHVSEESVDRLRGIQQIERERIRDFAVSVEQRN